jgi:hypothetical protein
MPVSKSGAAMLFAATGAALAVSIAPTIAPLAGADSCDPAVTVCQGNEVQTGPTAAPAPPVAAPDEQYPFDDEWYFNPAGGGTALQPAHPGGGGHH